MPTPSHVELALYADNTIIIATSHVAQADAARQLPGVKPQWTSTVAEWMSNRHRRLKELLDDLRVSRTALHSTPAQRMGLLGPLLNSSDLSIKNGVLLRKQLFRPVKDYAYPVWRSAARTHIQRLQSKCLCLVTGAPWYLSNKQIHGDLGVPLIAYHVVVLTASFNSKLADMGNPLVRQLGRYLRWPRIDPVARGESYGRRRPSFDDSQVNESRPALISRALFGCPIWGFPWFS
jgi:hypothetical protein